MRRINSLITRPDELDRSGQCHDRLKIETRYLLRIWNWPLFNSMSILLFLFLDLPTVDRITSLDLGFILVSQSLEFVKNFQAEDWYLHACRGSFHQSKQWLASHWKHQRIFSKALNYTFFYLNIGMYYTHHKNHKFYLCLSIHDCLAKERSFMGILFCKQAVNRYTQ